MSGDTFSKQLLIEEKNVSLQVVCDFFNQRLRVDDYRGYVYEVLGQVEKLVKKYKFAKAIVKGRQEHLLNLMEYGFQLEAVIPNYYNGSTAYCTAKYYETSRQKSNDWIHEDQILHSIQALSSNLKLLPLPSSYCLRKANERDAFPLSRLYKAVFPVYPTPLHDASYIQNILETDSLFYVIEYEKEIVSAASADVNRTYHNAELTDCATLPEHRQHGLMKHLLLKLEQELYSQQIYCAYTIARALSFGMNAAFKQLGYSYCGRFTNNCFIYDKLEDMNVWMKDLSIP